MKFAKIALSLLLAFVICSAFSFKKDKKTVYAFGVSTSFTDTVVYYTDIQLLDSVQLKNGFLPKRDLYSYQLKNYLEGVKGLPDRTCMIYFSKDKDKLGKELLKFISKYQKSKAVTLQKVDTVEFHFTKPQG
ncbi:hypothetical protein [uncultured Bacteroides sp.]|uniref:hypothetical protein n=1 Tax=uncultured Bacteroides sp. TaxID=162156 RepID=UPI002AA76D22|nr:hypothetical protein [uncultured Bacteroides sp.]